MSRWKTALTLHEIVRLCGVLVNFYCASCAKPPQAVTLDIDDNSGVAHWRQELSRFNAHCDECRFLAIHIYHTDTWRPIDITRWPTKTPSDMEARGHLRQISRRIR